MESISQASPWRRLAPRCQRSRRKARRPSRSRFAHSRRARNHRAPPWQRRGLATIAVRGRPIRLSARCSIWPMPAGRTRPICPSQQLGAHAGVGARRDVVVDRAGAQPTGPAVRHHEQRVRRPAGRRRQGRHAELTRRVHADIHHAPRTPHLGYPADRLHFTNIYAIRSYDASRTGSNNGGTSDPFGATTTGAFVRTWKNRDAASVASTLLHTKWLSSPRPRLRVERHARLS